jgi:hypothetical protein
MKDDLFYRCILSAIYHQSGYYIVDTVTGKVVDSKSEVHKSKK